jgi:hypothetical protein
MGRYSCWVLLFLIALATTAGAADVPFLPTAVEQPSTGFEARFGAFAHGVGSVEKNTAAVSLDLVTPRAFSVPGSPWEVLIPRAYLGGMFNVQGRTSSLRGGALWTFPIAAGFFAEAFFGGAVHDGSLDGDASHNALGSRVLFNVGGSLGYQFDRNWSAMFTFDHLSNGNRVFETGFNRNVGINSYGLKVAYRF